MIFAFGIVSVPTWVRRSRELKAIGTRDFRLVVLAGFFLAVHFATWIYSLELTTVAISVVLVNTAPLWVLALTALTTTELLSKAQIQSTLIAVLGTILISWEMKGYDSNSRDVLGAALAVLGAMALAAYLLIGRTVQRRVSLLTYVTVCYGVAAVFLLLTAIITRQQICGFSWSAWAYLLVLAFVCQFLGHSSNNWALRYLSAAVVSVALLGEPILSTAWAYLLFHESLTLWQVCGSVLVLVGVYLAIRAE